MVETYSLGTIRELTTDSMLVLPGVFSLKITDSKNNDYNLTMYDFFPPTPGETEEDKWMNEHLIHTAQAFFNAKSKIGVSVLFLKERKDNSRKIFQLADNWIELPIPVESLSYPVDASDMTKVSVAILLEALGKGHLDNDKHVLERMQLYAHPDALIKDVMTQCLKKLKDGKTAASSKYDRYKKVEGFFMNCVANVSYEGIHPGSETYVEKTGAEFKKAGLPWYVIGQKEKANPGQPLSETDTLKSRKIGSSNVIYCNAYLPGNQLQSYPGSGHRQSSNSV